MRRRAALNPLRVHFNVFIASLNLTVSFRSGPLGGATVKSFLNMVARAITGRSTVSTGIFRTNCVE